jgi:hypothetical protein
MYEMHTSMQARRRGAIGESNERRESRSECIGGTADACMQAGRHGNIDVSKVSSSILRLPSYRPVRLYPGKQASWKYIFLARHR